jgi:bacillithiol system protein YtxJ
MNWNTLTTLEELDTILDESQQRPVVIFKHSTTCSISAAAKARIERQWASADLHGVTPYYLDLLRFRPISNAIATRLNIVHESPQLLLVKGGRCVYDASHMSIRLDAVGQAAKAA